MLQPSDTTLVYLLWALAAGALVAVIAVWPMLAGRGFLPIFGRCAAHLGASALMVLAVAGTLNQQNGWYASWTDLSHDLTGTAPSIQRQSITGQRQGGPLYDRKAALAADRRTQSRFGAERSAFAQRAGLRTHTSQQGRYVHLVVPGLGRAAGRGAGRVLIWLPPSYGSRAASKTTYPVLQAYAGIPGGPSDFPQRMRLHTMITSAHRFNGLTEPIVIMPDYTPGGLDTECTNSPGVAMDTWLNTTIPNWVIHHLRARPDRTSWATTGYSAGGFCAQVSAFDHPQRFGAAMLFGSYNHPLWGNWRPYGRRTVWPAKYNLATVVRTHPPAVDAWIEVSQSDRFSEPEARRLIRAVRAPTSLTAVYLPAAGHRFTVWRSVMPTALAWLARTEPGFRAGRALPTFSAPSPAAHQPAQRSAPVSGVALR